MGYGLNRWARLLFAIVFASAFFALYEKASASTVSCPGTVATNDREFTLTTTGDPVCVAYGDGNINGNPAQDPILMLPAGYQFIDKSDLVGTGISITGLTTGSGTITWTTDLSGYETIYLALKSGLGQLSPSWVLFELPAGFTLPMDWTISNQGLSHANLYGISAVPLPAALPLFGAALAGIGIYSRRRRKAVA